MRPLRFGIVTLLLVLVYCGGIALRAFYHVPVPPQITPARPVTEAGVATAKRDLCRLARSERAFYTATGHYADASELPANDSSLPAGEAPYRYSVRATVPFVIVATAYGPLRQQPPALLVDDRLQVCTVRSHVGGTAWHLDDPPPKPWGHVSYECEPCPQPE